MDRSEYSHLYHDSHFSSLSGMLEAREHLRAREVNAREQRLLHQQDRLLQQAKVSCHRRHSWELANVRRDLHAILERTPTFDRSLKDEQWRMSTGRPLTIHGYAAESDVSQSCAGKQKQKATAATIFNSVPSSYKSFPRPSRTQLSPISTTKRDIVNRNVYKTISSPSETNPLHISENPAVDSCGMTPTNHQDHRARTRQVANHPRSTDPQKPYQVTPTPSNHRCPRLGDDGKSKTFYPGELTQLNCPLPGSWLPSPDLHSQGQQRKGALLRRRSHHAIMAIVRSKTKHQLRRFQSSVATDQAVSPGNTMVNPSSKSLTDLPSVCSPNALAVKDAPWSCERQSPLSASVTSNSSSSKGSWLSVPISMPDVTEAGQEPRDLTDARARPRFYSVE